ncbi:uncharacterized protein LOC125206092 [Salvia hispanica]|uniref:uncharacterized protein LOC125206092 n=1 Tax=Salvia hispanica TaxID=49212 RepID=UPI002009694B|nr:uncharacterized protein LOC125206092 [Salvia hispanica]
MADIEAIIDIPKSQRRMLHRVPVQLRRRGKTDIYEAVVVSLGPYHHRRKGSQLHLVEPFKDELRDMLCRGADRRSSLMSNIYEIRHFYGGADGYTDEELAEMMLRNACFLICYMHGFRDGNNTTYFQMSERMGKSAMMFAPCETLMLENQIPLWLISLIHPNQSLLCEYLSYYVYGDYRMTQLSWTKEEEPLHLLEALHRTFLRLVETQQNSSFFWNQGRHGRSLKQVRGNIWTVLFGR